MKYGIFAAKYGEDKAKLVALAFDLGAACDIQFSYWKTYNEHTQIREASENNPDEFLHKGNDLWIIETPWDELPGIEINNWPYCKNELVNNS